ncbi:hypothetical protein BJV78DRAFT_1156945 [Lactifluus subvellereus]|nr:hypothetical protein BJV78DRAFT_1156945 [Lactifluus subvellereus]
MRFTSSPVFLGVVMASFLLSSQTMATYAFATCHHCWILREIGRRVNFEGNENMDATRGITLPVLVLGDLQWQCWTLPEEQGGFGCLLLIKIGDYIAVVPQMQGRDRQEGEARMSPIWVFLKSKKK